ncbi:MAG: hypothetical protein CSA97_04615 [Bacteroidetes bacterium]|nr:MAG: hypothetical protein CSA97_04615 [Bacteroidota bacterium]
MKHALYYVRPVIAATDSRVDYDILSQAREFHDEGDHLKAIHAYIDFLDPDFRKMYGNKMGTKFVIPHGSIIVNIEVRDDWFYVWADFLNIPEQGKIAMLRQVAELNSGRLMLARFVMHEGKLRIEYHCPVEHTHPDKLVSLFRNICYVGDKYDDEFCTQFGATRVYEPQIRPYSQEEVKRVYDAFKLTSAKAIEDAAQSIKDRNLGEAWAQISMAFSQFEFYALPKGSLEAECEDALEALDEDLPIPERVAIATKKLEEMMARPMEEFAKDLYYTQNLTPLKGNATMQTLQEYFEDVVDVCKQAMDANDYPYVTTRFSHLIYKIYNLFEVSPAIHTLFSNVLEEVSNKPVQEAAQKLFGLGISIMNGDIDLDDYEPEEGGSSPSSEGADHGVDLEAMQQAMAEAMQKGDMQEYMRLAMEMQQAMQQHYNS